MTVSRTAVRGTVRIMSQHETHPSDEAHEEGHDEGMSRRVEEDAQRYPGHEDPDAARDEVGLGEEGRRGAPEGAPEPD
jgi:hypothetical protein